MHGKTDTTIFDAARIARIAWLATFVVPLVLTGLLLMAKTGQTSPLDRSVVPFAFEELEGEEGEYEGECSEAEVEFEEGELSETELGEICEVEEETEKARAAGVAPPECLLRSAHAHAAVNDRTDKLKLTLGYTTYEPVSATIKLGKVATIRRHLGRSGVLRLVKPLRTSHPKRLVLQIQLPSVQRAGCPSRRLVLFPR